MDFVLDEETNDAIAVLTRSGFYDRETIMEIVCQEMFGPGEVDEAAVGKAIDAEMRALAAERATWPEVTDCDRLDEAFGALNARNIIALQNAGYTQSDGYDDFQEAYARHPKKASVIGYCFYHGQDLERAVRGEGLWLAFGPVDPKREATDGPKVGAIIRDELQRVGLPVEWDGTFGQRISVPRFKWQKRA